MVYASPVPSAYIDGSYYEDSGRPFYLSDDKLAGDFSPVRFQRELGIFNRFCKGGKVLDVGCSTGAFLFALKEKYPGAYDAFGTDVSGPALDHAETLGLTVFRENFLSPSFAPGKFKAITFWATLEHVEQPGLFLLKAHELLEPGGFCFVLVPNFRSLAIRLLGVRYRYVLAQHLNYFTRATLEKIASPPFVPVWCSTTHFNPWVVWQDWKGTEKAGDQARASLLVKTNKLKSKKSLAPVRAIYLLAEKFLGAVDLADNCVMVLRK